MYKALLASWALLSLKLSHPDIGRFSSTVGSSFEKIVLLVGAGMWMKFMLMESLFEFSNFNAVLRMIL